MSAGRMKYKNPRGSAGTLRGFFLLLKCTAHIRAQRCICLQIADLAVAFGPPVTEEPPGQALFPDGGKVILGVENGIALPGSLGQDGAGGVGHEAGAVEAQGGTLSAVFGAGNNGLGAETVGRGEEKPGG